MEYFGSKPGSPVDECLAAVKTCSVYIGIFGMRYGTVPEGHSLSMTHLEYAEAQRCELPSLVYILDEENQPVLLKFVDTGMGAESLRNLKAKLLKTHTVSFFTTPEDLASKVLHDVPLLLKDLGKEVAGDVEAAQENTADIVARFFALPQRNRGREVVFEHVVEGFSPLEAAKCEALGLPFGATLHEAARVHGRHFDLYAHDKLAERLYEVAKGTSVTIRGVTTYGTTKEIEWGEDSPITNIHEHRGIVIRELVDLRPPESD